MLSGRSRVEGFERGANSNGRARAFAFVRLRQSGNFRGLGDERHKPWNFNVSGLDLPNRNSAWPLSPGQQDMSARQLSFEVLRLIDS